jgi:hypothetical protein
MQYRFLGPTGIKVSVISFGNWVNSNSKDAQELTNKCVKQAWDLGINFFDTAEVYGNISLNKATEKPKDKSESPSTPLTSPDTISSSPPKFSGENQKIYQTLAVFLEST